MLRPYRRPLRHLLCPFILLLLYLLHRPTQEVVLPRFPSGTLQAEPLASNPFISATATAKAKVRPTDVRVEITKSAPGNPSLISTNMYKAMVTLRIESTDGTLTPSVWSTRREDGGNGNPFTFQPGKNLIEGWTRGVLQMRVGERAVIHVPSKLGYGSRGNGVIIPGNSDLHFDIEILGVA